MLRAAPHHPHHLLPLLLSTNLSLPPSLTLHSLSSSPSNCSPRNTHTLLYKTLIPNPSHHGGGGGSSILVSAMAMNRCRLSTKPPRVSSTGQGSVEVGREILVQHLLVKDDDVKLLSELQKRIAKGEDLSDLAVDYSICPSKDKGGILGWVRRGQMVPEFEEAAFGAPVNKVVKCKTKFGWHLLQVLSEREESMLQDIQPDHLHEKLQDPCFVEEAQLIDVREPHEVAQASLPGFQVLPLRQFGNWGPEITTKFDPEKDTYVLCHHGVRSLQVAQWLQTQGFKKVFNVSGGIHAYALKVDPSIPTY